MTKTIWNIESSPTASVLSFRAAPTLAVRGSFEILRFINRIFQNLFDVFQASLLDAASGTFVRFRLAGEKFPPNIYYKVFTKRPVVDMCANSPKNYAQQKSLKLPAREQNNRTKATEYASQPSKHDEIFTCIDFSFIVTSKCRFFHSISCQLLCQLVF